MSRRISEKFDLSRVKQELNYSSSHHDLSDSEDSGPDDTDRLPSRKSDSDTAGTDSSSQSSSDDSLPSINYHEGKYTRIEKNRITANPVGQHSLITSHVLHGTVSSPLDFDIVRKPGSLTTHDIDTNSDNEYYIFRFPTGMINPANLVDAKFTLGGERPHRIEVNGSTYEVSTYRNSVMADSPTLFLPSKTGKLNQVDVNITGHIVMKEPPSKSIDIKQFNIDDLRMKIHKPPKIKARNFFGASGPETVYCNEQITPQPRKRSKEEKSLAKKNRRTKEAAAADDDDMEISPGKKMKSLDSIKVSSTPVTLENERQKSREFDNMSTEKKKKKKKSLDHYDMSSPLISPSKIKIEKKSPFVSSKRSKYVGQPLLTPSRIKME